MRIVLRCLLAGAATALLAVPAGAQLDLSPPGAGPAARPAPQRSRTPVVRAPRRAPVPEPRPAEAGPGEAAPEEPELSSLPPTPVAPAPVAPEPPAVAPPVPEAAPVPAPTAPAATAPVAPEAAPETPANPIDEAFRDAARSSSRAAPIPPNHPAVLGAPARSGLPPPPAPLPPQGGAPLSPPRAEAPTGSTAAAGAPGPHFNWNDHETRIRQIEQRFGGQNYGIIAR